MFEVWSMIFFIGSYSLVDGKAVHVLNVFFCKQLLDISSKVILVFILQHLWVKPKYQSHSGLCGFTSGLTVPAPDWLRKGGLLHTCTHYSVK